MIDPPRRDPSPGALRLIRLILHALVVVVPLGYSNLSWLPWSDGSLTFDEYDTLKVFLLYSLVIAAAAIWAFSFIRHGTRLRRTRADWLMIALLVWAVIATALSEQPATSFLGKYRRYDGLTTFAAYALVYFLSVQSFLTPDHRRKLARTICLGAGVVAAYGVTQYLGFDPTPRSSVPFESRQAFSTMGNPNLLAGYLIFPLALGVALALSESLTSRRAVYWSLVLVVAAAWITSFTRGAWIGGLVALAFVVIAFVRGRLRPTWVDAGFAVAGAALGAAIVAHSSSSQNPITNLMTRALSTFQFREGSALQRYEIWRGALASVRANPVFGHGPDTFRLVFKRFGPREYVADAGWGNIADNAHNYALQIASGLGIPGTLLLYGFLFYSLWLSARSAFSRLRPPQALVLAGFWAAVVGYVIHLVFGISVVGSSVLLWMSLGVLLGPSSRTRDLCPSPWGRPAAIAVIVAALLGIAGSAMIPVADHYFLMANLSPSIEQRLAGARRAVRLNPFVDAYRSELGNIHMDLANSWLLQANADMRAGRDPDTSVRAAEVAAKQAMADYENAIAFVPLESENYLNLAIAANQAGQIDPGYYSRALEAVARGLQVDPYNPGMRVEAAWALFQRGQTVEAISLCEEAASLDPRFARPRALLGELYAAVGRTADALAAYKAALALDPRDAAVRQAIEALEAIKTDTARGE